MVRQDLPAEIQCNPSQVESLILIGISTLGKHSTFLGTLPLLTGIQFCGGVLLVPVTLCIFGLARKEREFLTTRKYFLALILAYAIILGVQVSTDMSKDRLRDPA